MPLTWTEVLGHKEVYGKTLKEVDLAWEHAEKDFKERVTHKRKVILYKFEASALQYTHDAKGEVTGCLFRANEMNFTKGTALDLWFCVCYELSSSFSKEFQYVDMKGHHVGSDSAERPCYKKMDWTKERELFFVQFDAQLIDLIARVHVFLHGDVKVLEDLIAKFKNVAALPKPEEIKGEK